MKSLNVSWFYLKIRFKIIFHEKYCNMHEKRTVQFQLGSVVLVKFWHWDWQQVTSGVKREHSVIKRFKKHEEISVCKTQGSKLILDAL